MAVYMQQIDLTVLNEREWDKVNMLFCVNIKNDLFGWNKMWT